MTPTSEIWISIATTERPTSLRLLASDLAQQSDEIGCSLRLFVVDNGRTVASHRATEDALAGFASERRSLRIDVATTSGGSIARSRRDQREQLRDPLRAMQPPFVWMLDDDLRLDHLVIDGDRLVTRRLHNHLAFLLDLKCGHPELDVLLGEVTGDPPIPPIATYASRLEDLVGSLRIMAALPPHLPLDLALDRADLEGVDTVYYDFAGTPQLAASRRPWIPRTAGSVAELFGEMLADACDIPFGVAFSRPIVANASTFEELRDDTVRGAHAVFFGGDAFLSHRYPSLSIQGIETRRGDTLASSLFAQARPGRIRRSGFSVRHTRPRDGRFLPSADDLAVSLLSDTWGAALTRAIATDTPTISNFLIGRADRIDAAFARTRNAIDELRAFDAPPWAGTHRELWNRLDARLTWTLEMLHQLEAAHWRNVLTLPAHQQALADFAERLREDPDAE